MVSLCFTLQWSVFVVPHLLLSMLLLSPHGDYPSLRHNIRDTTAQLMSEVCSNVATEPTLQPVMNECFFHCSANTESGACFDGDFGGFTINKLILKCMCLSPWLCLIIKPQCLLALDPMIVRNIKHMNNRSMRWKEDLSPLIFWHLMV